MSTQFLTKKALYALLAIFAIASLVLAACGNSPSTPAAPTTEPTIVPMPNMTHKEVTMTWNEKYVFAAERLTEVKGTTSGQYDLITLTKNAQKYSVKASIIPPQTQYVEWNVSLAINAVDNSNHKTAEVECYSTDTGHEKLSRSDYNSMGTHTVSTQVSAFCPLPDNGTLWVYFNFTVDDQTANLLEGQTLTPGTGTTPVNTKVPTLTLAAATPSATPTIIGSPTNTATAQLGATLTALPTYVNGGAFDSNGVYVIGNRTSVGIDTNNPQSSFFFWKPGEAGFLYTTSNHAMFKQDTDPTHAMVRVDAQVANSHDECWFFNKALSNQNYKPCYIIPIPAKTVSVAPTNGTVAYLYPMDHGHVDGGPEAYAPHVPKPTSTASITPTNTSTPTAVVTQNVTLASPVANDAQLTNDCNGGNNVVTYQVSEDPDSGTCLPNLTNLPSGTAQWKFGTAYLHFTVFVNTETQVAVYILGSEIDPGTTTCVMNGTTFANSSNRSNWVRVSKGNWNTRVACTLNDGKVLTGIAVVQ
jgi:hypothetical protein